MRNLIFVVCCILIGQQIKGQSVEEIKSAPPVRLSGALTTGFQAYKAYGINPRSANPMWNISGSASLALYGFDIPVSFTLGRQGNNVNYPAFRQLGASPQWRWLTVHAGWRNMQFSPYTLSGHTFRGAGIELKPGKFRFAAMQGRLRQARAESDSVQSVFFPATYKRTGYGVKIGVGTEASHFDLIYFRAKDDVGSLPLAIQDSTLIPGENAVWGYATRLKLGKHASFFSDGAISMYTRNLRSTTFGDTTLIPEIPSLLMPRFSTRLNYAARAGLEFSHRQFQVRTIYERIAPNFETMGSYFFNNDIENIMIAPNFGFARNKARLFGSLGLQRNNLLGNRSETTKRVIGNAVLSVNPSPKFGFDANYMNAGINQYDGRARLNDSIRVAILNTNLSLTPHWNWFDSLNATNLVVSGHYQILNDRNPFTREFGNMKTLFANAFFNRQYLLSEWGWSAGLNINQIVVSNLNTQRFGVTAGINKTWSDGNGNAGLTATWNKTLIEGNNDGALMSASLNIGWTLAKVYQLSVFTSVLRSYSTAYEDYTELQGGVTISRSFGHRRSSRKDNQ